MRAIRPAIYIDFALDPWQSAVACSLVIRVSLSDVAVINFINLPRSVQF